MSDPKPILEEIAKDRAAIGWYFNRLKENPDKILREKGGTRGVELFDEMFRTDTHLAHLFEVRRNALVSNPYEIEAASDDARDQEIAEFVRDVFEDLRDFLQDLKELMSAVPRGFAVSEVMWGQRDGQVVVEELRQRMQGRFAFGLENELVFLPDGWHPEPVPDRKFLVHTYAPENENRYGSPVLSQCYWPYFFKKHGVKYWAIFQERFGLPFVVGKYKRGADDKEKAGLKEIIDTFRSDTGLLVPDDVVIELIEAKASSGTLTFEKFIAIMDRWQTKLVLGQILSTEEGQRGSMALGIEHGRIRYEFARADAASVMGPINHDLIPWLVDFNFPNVKQYPEMQIVIEEAEDLQVRAERDKIIVVDMKLPVAKRYLYETYGIPEPEEGDELLEIPSAPSTSFPSTSSGSFPFGKDGETFAEDARAKRGLNTPDRIVRDAKRAAYGIFDDLMDDIKKKEYAALTS